MGLLSEGLSYQELLLTFPVHQVMGELRAHAHSMGSQPHAALSCAYHQGGQGEHSRREGVSARTVTESLCLEATAAGSHPRGTWRNT